MPTIPAQNHKGEPEVIYTAKMQTQRTQGRSSNAVLQFPAAWSPSALCFGLCIIPLCQHKHLCSCIGNWIQELIHVRTIFLFFIGFNLDQFPIQFDVEPHKCFHCLAGIEEHGSSDGNSTALFGISFFLVLEIVELRSEKPRDQCNVLQTGGLEKQEAWTKNPSYKQASIR